MNPRYSAPLIKSVALGIAIATAGVSTHAADDPRIGTYVTTATRNAAADAPPRSATRSMTVSYRDLDLSRPAGIVIPHDDDLGRNAHSAKVGFRKLLLGEVDRRCRLSAVDDLEAFEPWLVPRHCHSPTEGCLPIHSRMARAANEIPSLLARPSTNAIFRHPRAPSFRTSGTLPCA